MKTYAHFAAVVPSWRLTPGLMSLFLGFRLLMPVESFAEQVSSASSATPASTPSMAVEKSGSVAVPLKPELPAALSDSTISGSRMEPQRELAPQRPERSPPRKAVLPKDLISLQDLYMIRIRDHSKAEISTAIKRIEAVTIMAVSKGELSPVKLVLSGDELRLFLRAGYGGQQNLVDRVARLESLGVLEVKACETWMRSQGVTPTDIMPFIETVPYGPDEVKRLTEEGYHYL
jgi:intracellular sulfur oxidation DsrE/DsrF family protein